VISDIDRLRSLELSLLGITRTLPPQITIRNLSILLTVYLGEEQHTVRGLSKYLKIKKAAVCRAIDTLCKMDLIQRLPDARDRRSIIVGRTGKGVLFLKMIASNLSEIER